MVENGIQSKPLVFQDAVGVAERLRKVLDEGDFFPYETRDFNSYYSLQKERYVLSEYFIMKMLQRTESLLSERGNVGLLNAESKFKKKGRDKTDYVVFDNSDNENIYALNAQVRRDLEYTLLKDLENYIDEVKYTSVSSIQHKRYSLLNALTYDFFDGTSRYREKYPKDFNELNIAEIEWAYSFLRRGIGTATTAHEAIRNTMASKYKVKFGRPIEKEEYLSLLDRCQKPEVLLAHHNLNTSIPILHGLEQKIEYKSGTYILLNSSYFDFREHRLGGLEFDFADGVWEELKSKFGKELFNTTLGCPAGIRWDALYPFADEDEDLSSVTSISAYQKVSQSVYQRVLVE